ncbi:unnamed protein product [Urochloa humidicola]
MAILGSMKKGAKYIATPWYACATGKVTKGYVPMMLVDGEDGEQAEKILVLVKLLREPCMAALLELAEQKFGRRTPQKKLREKTQEPM